MSEKRIEKAKEKSGPAGPHKKPWMRILSLAIIISVLLMATPKEMNYAVLRLIIGIIIISKSSEALIDGVERLAIRKKWNSFFGGTIAEITATLPEFAVIIFVVFVSPQSALLIALVTIFNNALIFGLYSLFLPKDEEGDYHLPEALTKSGIDTLNSGAAISFIIGACLLSLWFIKDEPVNFDPRDQMVLGMLMFTIFIAYMYTLMRFFSEDAKSDEEEKEDEFYDYDHRDTSMPSIGLSLSMGVLGAFMGGEAISGFVDVALEHAALSEIQTAIIVAFMAGMGEYVIVYKSHRMKDYGLALSNVFGGISQVMFLVLPFTLITIAVSIQAGWVATFPLDFKFTILYLLLFPLFYILHTSIVDDFAISEQEAVGMSGVVILLLYLLLVYG